MEPQNHLVEKEHHLNETFIFGCMLILQGVLSDVLLTTSFKPTKSKKDHVEIGIFGGVYLLIYWVDYNYTTP